MAEFPRTTVGGVSVSRMIVGTNWFLGYSHQSNAKDKFIRDFQNRDNVANILTEFFKHGVDTVMGMPVPMVSEAIKIAEDRTGRKATLILTPFFNLKPGGAAENDPEPTLDNCKKLGATFCFPHTGITDQMLDTLNRTLRGYDGYAKMIREREMIPGLSTHRPETVVVCDSAGYDVATYIQIFNAMGFLMPVEPDWIMNVIRHAKKPVMTIKPLAAGRLIPAVGLTFSWNAIRDQDMITIGTTTPDEAKEVVEISFDILARRLPQNELQKTRSKKALTD